MHDTIAFKSQENIKNIEPQLGFSECRVYHNALLESYSQSKLDRLRQLHTLDMTEDDKNRSWECTKILKYGEEIGVDAKASAIVVKWIANTNQILCRCAVD